MKGKVAFVVGLSVGYVLGARAGKARYEQIKKGAKSLWQTAPVVKARARVSGFAREKVSGVQDFVVSKGKQALYAVTDPQPEK